MVMYSTQGTCFNHFIIRIIIIIIINFCHSNNSIVNIVVAVYLFTSTARTLVSVTHCGYVFLTVYSTIINGQKFHILVRSDQVDYNNL